MARYNRRNDAATGEFLWLVSLSDLMILLFVFFVVLFSFAYKKLESGDFRKIAELLSNAPAAQQANPLDEIQAKLLKWVVDKKLLESVDLERKQDALILQIKEHVLFDSGSASLKEEALPLLDAMKLLLERVPAPYRIGIEGHTDDTPVKGGGYIDNWELSTRRALGVMKAMNLNEEIKKRAVVMGYGEMKPVVPNRDAAGKVLPQNQSKNRRVTIRVY